MALKRPLQGPVEAEFDLDLSDPSRHKVNLSIWQSPGFNVEISLPMTTIQKLVGEYFEQIEELEAMAKKEAEDAA